MVLCIYFVCFLVEYGYCCDIYEVFECYLGDGKLGYVLYCWVCLVDVINWIKGVGGVVVMVYLGCYMLLLVEYGVLFDEFKVLGGEGVEVIIGSYMFD